MACDGNSAEICGGPDRLNLFEATTTPDPDDTPNPDEPPTVGCKRVADPDLDQFACNVRGFDAPPGIAPVLTPDLTIAECAAACASTTGCGSYAYDRNAKACGLYENGVWFGVGAVATAAGANYKNIFLDDIECWTCT